MKTQIKIDKNVPIPVKIGKGSLPLASMKVGDSFFVEIPKGKVLHSVRSAVLTNAKNYTLRNKHANDWKFSSRLEGAGFRVWRIQ